MENNWYILYNGQQVGPMSKEQLLHYGLNPNSQVWRDGMPQWVAAYTLPELMSLLPVGGPTAPAYGGEVSVTGKSKVAAGVLAILLGGLGIQYFYCGKVAGGFICILLTLVTCGLWEILSLVQGIMMLSMSEHDFEQKYVLTDKTFPLF